MRKRGDDKWSKTRHRALQPRSCSRVTRVWQSVSAGGMRQAMLAFRHVWTNDQSRALNLKHLLFIALAQPRHRDKHYAHTGPTHSQSSLNCHAQNGYSPLRASALLRQAALLSLAARAFYFRYVNNIDFQRYSFQNIRLFSPIFRLTHNSGINLGCPYQFFVWRFILCFLLIRNLAEKVNFDSVTSRLNCKICLRPQVLWVCFLFWQTGHDCWCPSKNSSLPKVSVLCICE